MLAGVTGFALLGTVEFDLITAPIKRETVVASKLSGFLFTSQHHLIADNLLAMTPAPVPVSLISVIHNSIRLASKGLVSVRITVAVMPTDSAKAVRMFHADLYPLTDPIWRDSSVNAWIIWRGKWETFSAAVRYSLCVRSASRRAGSWVEPCLDRVLGIYRSQQSGPHRALNPANLSAWPGTTCFDDILCTWSG